MNLPIVDMMGTGKCIKALLNENNMSIKDLQMILGFTTPNAIYKWIHGRCLPSIDNLVCLAVIFKVPIENILVVEKEAA